MAETRHGTASTAIFLAVTILGWGGNYALVKLALADCSPFIFNAIRFTGVAVVLAAALRLSGRPLIPRKDELLWLGLVGPCQVTLMLGFTTMALVWIEASRSVLLAYTMPLWAIIFGRLILGESITMAMVTGTVIGLSGLALLFNPLVMNWADRYALIGSVFGIIGSMGAILYRRRTWRSPFWSQVLWQVLVGSIPLVLMALIFESGFDVRLTPTLLLVTVYNWLVPVALAYWCWAQVLSRMSASAAGQIMLLAPVFGVTFAIVLLGEPFEPALLAAGALIIYGAWLALCKPKFRKTQGDAI
jgi:drug/metabolite transporter (DMT)-like permease